MPAIWALDEVWAPRDRKGLEGQLIYSCKALWWGSLRFTRLVTFLPPSHVIPPSWPPRITIINTASEPTESECFPIMSWGDLHPFPIIHSWGRDKEECTYFNILSRYFRKCSGNRPGFASFSGELFKSDHTEEEKSIGTSDYLKYSTKYAIIFYFMLVISIMWTNMIMKSF